MENSHISLVFTKISKKHGFKSRAFNFQHLIFLDHFGSYAHFI